MGYKKRTIQTVLDGIFVAGAELGNVMYPELKFKILDNAEATLRKLLTKELKGQPRK